MQEVEVFDTKQIEMFIPILREIDFCDVFRLDILHWCQIGHPTTPLEYWRIFLLKVHSEIVGISGLYKTPGMAPTICWLGWFAIRPQFRRRNFGTSAIHVSIGLARAIPCEELWVFTDSTDSNAHKFYQRLGFERLGLAEKFAPGKTGHLSDIIFRWILTDKA